LRYFTKCNSLSQHFTAPTALVVGTEATGLTQEWREAPHKYNYSMQGEIDSMNVSLLQPY
jgi:TrmH family RNA methyltransferase